jgi:hypothetical protein
MTHATFCSLVLIMMTGIAAPAAYSQQTPDAAKTPPAAQDTAPAATPAPLAAPVTVFTSSPPTSAAAKKTATSADTSDLPSADTLRKAKDAGYHTKVKKGVVYYCKDIVETGTRFKTESCVDEDQLVQILVREQAQRDQLTNRSCAGGCGGSGK